MLKLPPPPPPPPSVDELLLLLLEAAALEEEEEGGGAEGPKAPSSKILVSPETLIVAALVPEPCRTETRSSTRSFRVASSPRV